MGALVRRFQVLGVSLTALPGDRIKASGTLTDAMRAEIRANKSAILAELAANDAATPEQAAELRRLVVIIAADWPDAEQAEALAVALADPDAALTCFRALVADRQEPSPALDNGMRACVQCANLVQSGRCLAAWRGESFGTGAVVLTRRYAPASHVPQRCGQFRPLSNDPDQRSGRERWQFRYGAPPATARPDVATD